MSKASEKWLLWNLFYNLVILFTQSLNDRRVILCWFCVRTTKATCHLLYLFQALKPTSIWEPKFDVPKTGMLMCKLTYSVLLWYLLDLCRTSMKKCFCKVFFFVKCFLWLLAVKYFHKKIPSQIYLCKDFWSEEVKKFASILLCGNHFFYFKFTNFMNYNTFTTNIICMQQNSNLTKASNKLKNVSDFKKFK